MRTPTPLLEAALALPEEERAELALRLVESLDGAGSDEGADDAWADEVAVRIEALRAGHAEIVSADEAFQAARRRLRAPRG